MVTEWNYGLMDPMPTAVQRASFITAALIYMQDAPIDAATLYRADSVFGSDGATPDKTGQALIALGRLKDTPLRLRVRGADLNGFAVEAARSADGHTVQVLLSNYQIPSEFLGPRAADDVLHVPPVFDVSCSHAAASPTATTPATTSPSITSRRIGVTASSAAAFRRLTISPAWERRCTAAPPSTCRMSCRRPESSWSPSAPSMAPVQMPPDGDPPPPDNQAGQLPTPDHCSAQMTAANVK